ncbi:hypothetical protein HPB47_020452 [Ixodes persulcatus]|uniref:Uncharacterized protein n=1 Tax=Ixodes persulcatus TaxID=34615 RepID=A0AC60QI04_IXOPE|nr:hypothetical protein HPB47_020452 [Ixodes persulcatus]
MLRRLRQWSVLLCREGHRNRFPSAPVTLKALNNPFLAANFDERQYPHPDLITSWDDDVKKWPDIRKESSSKDWLYTPSCAIQQTASVQCLEELHLPPKTEALIAVRIAADGETSGPTQTNPLPSVAWTLTLIENEVGHMGNPMGSLNVFRFLQD